MGCGRNHLSLHGLSIIDAMAPADYIESGGSSSERCRAMKVSSLACTTIQVGRIQSSTEEASHILSLATPTVTYRQLMMKTSS